MTDVDILNATVELAKTIIAGNPQEYSNINSDYSSLISLLSSIADDIKELNERGKFSVE